MAKNKKSPAVGGKKKKPFNESKAWKSGMAKLYGIGASIVIIGALFKIEHWEGASEMLIIGLGTEAFIFLMSAFEKPHADPKWELVYPELAVEDGEPAPKKPVDQLDDMLKDAGVDNAVLSRLGDGMRHLGDQAMQLSEVTDAAAATSEYGGALRTATEKVNGLTDTYAQVSESLTGLSDNSNLQNSFVAYARPIAHGRHGAWGAAWSVERGRSLHMRGKGRTQRRLVMCVGSATHPLG